MAFRQFFLHSTELVILNSAVKQFFFSALALCVCAAAPLSAQSKTGAALPSTDDYNQSQFWIGNFPEGQYVVHLSRIVAVAQHKYILDNACMVYEVTLITMGNTPTKFYYLETLGQGSGINAIRNVTNRAKELGSGAVNRATGGGIDPDTTVAKAYPNTNTVEFRVATLEQLNKMYASLLKAWQDGKGRTFKP